MNLTEAQVKAIEHPPENLQLIACAGSGKTEVVARRVVHLLDPEGSARLTPANIVAFTFTDKAAGELQERIVTRCREAFGQMYGLADMFVGTIHAFCLQLLKDEVPKYMKFEVLNEVQQRLLVDRNSTKSGLTACGDLKGKQLRRYVDTGHYLTALGILRETDTHDHVMEQNSIVEGLSLYEDLLDEKRYLDYSAILKTAVEVMATDEALRNSLSDRLRYVICDEYQDVNPIQEAIVRLLHDLGARICVVGDDDQTIYQWRGSDVQNILTFQGRYPNVEQVPLEDNFRSSVGIVETARQFIEQNTDRLPKVMQPTDTQEFQDGDLVALSFESPEEEAQYIAETMKALRGVVIREREEARGIDWSDMAVLLRSVRVNAGPVTKALAAADIPYVIVGMNNLFDTIEAQAARELFFFMAGEEGHDRMALAQSWDNANLGVLPDTLERAITQVAESKADLDTKEEKRWGLYSLQRLFLGFLEAGAVREERIPNGRGEVVFYNLGKFSQLISDFEAIHFHSAPKQKYASFASFLRYRAESAYPEGWQDNQYANPNAVRIMTIHQAKGMQWPVVFVPALLRNRFPTGRIGGRTVWHLIPREGVERQARFEGTVEDERRLFYVAMTRSQKFLHLTWAPIPGKNNRYVRASAFWEDILVSKYVKRRLPDYTDRERQEPTPRAEVANVSFSFSDLKYFFECPYQFKLRILYGFNAPIHEALGYGKSLHDALAEVHSAAILGKVPDPADVDQLLDTHLHTPFAYPALKAQLRVSAGAVLTKYLADNRELFDKLEFSEMQITIYLGDGVTVNGRIDLVRRIDTGEITVVDLKSSERAQAEEVTEHQLHIYALGYEELTGTRPDFVEIYELDEGKRKPRAVDTEFIDDVKALVGEAASALRTGTLPVAATPEKCGRCDYCGMCTAGAALVAEAN